MNDNEQRDELTGIIHAARKPWVTNTEHRRMEAAQADAILAAGYRKPRVITTVEELDALPEGSIILTPSTNPNYPSVFRKVWRGEWLELDPGDRNDGEYGVAAEGLLRWDSKDHTATVLFVPRRPEPTT